MRFARAALAAGLAAAAACSSVGDGAKTRIIKPTIVLANVSERASAPPGPYISVLDSIELRITPENGTRIPPMGRRLSRYNTTATLQPEFPPGNTTFSAEVFSNARVSVFSGSVTQLVTSDVLSLVLNVTATRPVLLVAPDTSKTNTVTSTTFTIYNVGTGTLAWNLTNTDTAFVRCGSGCSITPTSGSVPAGESATIRVTVPRNFPSRLFAFTFHSAVGDVTARWQYSASPIPGVDVQPSASLHALGQTFPLAATVQSSGTASAAVAWSTSNASVASVTSSGSVTGVSRGVATVTATSVADTAKRASADIRVYDSTATDASWIGSAPAEPDTVRRDDTSAGSRSTVTLSARAVGPLAGDSPPFTVVEFWLRPGSIGPWRRIGSTTAGTRSVEGGVRTWTWSFTWNPDATDAPFINPSTVGMSVLALGITASGQTMATPPNHNVFVRVP